MLVDTWSAPQVRMIVLFLVALLGLPRPAAAQSASLCFDTPGIVHCIEGRFLAYWRQHGGLPVFGYPRTAVYDEHTPDGRFSVQYFERHRFELHPEQPPPYDVLLGRLGAVRLQQLGRQWEAEPQGHPQIDCRWFPETRHAVCAGFRAYWESAGLDDPRLPSLDRSLQVFGLPLTEPRLETNAVGATVLTQWFERARLEWHPGQGIFLGLLGDEVWHNARPEGTLVGAAGAALDQFWSRTFEQHAWEYWSPLAIVVFDAPVRSGCGRLARGLLYCDYDYTLYLEQARLEWELQHFGDLAVVTILGHEWGHHLQTVRDARSPAPIELELQADCLAGVYAHDIQARGALQPGDLEEALASLEHAADPPGTSRRDPAAHGSAQERMAAFLGGFEQGVAGCGLG